jgi:hypothetical protein
MEITIPAIRSNVCGCLLHTPRQDGSSLRRSDLTGAGIRHGETGEKWRGIDVTAKGRHWAWPPSELDNMDAAKRIHWPEKSDGVPMLKRYLDEQSGMPAQDIIYPTRM